MSRVLINPKDPDEIPVKYATFQVKNVVSKFEFIKKRFRLLKSQDFQNYIVVQIDPGPKKSL